MITLQIINKVLESKDMSLIHKNGLTEEHFVDYPQEFKFLVDHYNQYGNVPDMATFLDKFNDFSVVEVMETDRYLIDTLMEEHLYYKSVGVVQKVAELLKTNSNDAVEYLQSQLVNLQPVNLAAGTNIITQADERLEAYNQKCSGATPWFIPSGFDELDEITNGWAMGEELVIIFARTGQGKSWVMTKTITHAWQMGKRVGYISPEMSPTKLGYRFDTIFKNFSNRALTWGKPTDGYSAYIKDLKTKENPFIVAMPKDFQRKVTVTKLKHFCESNKLDILAIDGIKYLTDERYKRGDNTTTSLTNISEDLITLSNELGIPILVVVQSNRGGVKEDGGEPELENIRDSDGISHNATKVISIRQTGAGLELSVKKHRDGATGGKVLYYWDIDNGIFHYIPSTEDSAQPETRTEKVKELKNTFKGGKDVF